MLPGSEFLFATITGFSSGATFPAPTEPLPIVIDPIVTLCERVGDKLGSVSTANCLDQNLTSSGVAVSGTHIALKEYPPIPTRRKSLGRVLLLGGIHGDEYSSVSIIFKWMDILNQYHSGLFHWHVAPLVNPDGLLRPNSQRMNANDVDLNRNFPTENWATESAKYWSNTGKKPRRYPGPSAASEPETRWVMEQIEQFKPDVIVQVHAPYGIVDFDGPEEPPQQLGQLRLRLLGTYPGSLGNYGGKLHNIPVVTIELPSAGALPPAEEISQIWVDLIAWLRKRLPRQTQLAQEPAATRDTTTGD